MTTDNTNYPVDQFSEYHEGDEPFEAAFAAILEANPFLRRGEAMTAPVMLVNNGKIMHDDTDTGTVPVVARSIKFEDLSNCRLTALGFSDLQNWLYPYKVRKASVELKVGDEIKVVDPKTFETKTVQATAEQVAFHNSYIVRFGIVENSFVPTIPD